MLQRLLASIIASALLSSVALGAVSTAQQTLDDMLRIFPRSAAWEQWLADSKELPPDFSALPAEPFLPDPLKRSTGEEIKSPEEWASRRQELLDLFKHYVTGTIPPVPGNVEVAESRSYEEPGARIEQMVLQFGPEHRARLHVELIIPKGRGPFPVFITQDNHRRWALVAVSRGYIGCVYAGADSRDDTGEWAAIWPEFDWTKLTRRAWAASRCIDHLYTRPDVDRDRIALTGHSRNGKTSIIAAAFDERIKAVISSSSGAGGACSFRFFSERHAAEGIEFITRSFPDWLHPRLRFFAGREEKLPIDMPELVACVAPRPFLFSTAWNDSVESVWAIEQSRENAGGAYALLGAATNINLLYREGPHATDAHDIERYVDWLDWKFGRTTRAAGSDRVYPTYAGWLRVSGETNEPTDFKPVSSETPRATRDATLKSVRWALGDGPPLAVSTPGAYGSEPQHLAVMLGRNNVPSGLAKRAVSFGNYIAGDLYYPTNAEQRSRKLPALIWLHPVSVATGYVPGYKRGEAPHLAFARAGFAVFAFDQIGNGTRIEEVASFYDRYPHWSILGKDVADTRSAVDALRSFSFVETNAVWLVGFENGATIALHAAAMDGRIAGVAAVGGFANMRPALSNRGKPVFAAQQRRLPLVPRLAAFVGSEDRLPYDFRELVDAIAPRPVLLFAPAVDEQVDAKDLQRAYLLQHNAQFKIVDDYNRFGPEVQKTVIEALKSVAMPAL